MRIPRNIITMTDLSDSFVFMSARTCHTVAVLVRRDDDGDNTSAPPLRRCHRNARANRAGIYASAGACTHGEKPVDVGVVVFAKGGTACTVSTTCVVRTPCMHVCISSATH